MARLVDRVPAVGEALVAGHISVAHALELSCGRIYTIRDDGTIVLSVGEREPDLSADELGRITRARVEALTAERPH